MGRVQPVAGSHGAVHRAVPACAERPRGAGDRRRAHRADGGGGGTDRLQQLAGRRRADLAADHRHQDFRKGGGRMSGDSDRRLDRRRVVRELLADRGPLLVVTGLGSPTWDTAAAGDDARNFYLWGAMGSAVTVALGLALAQPQRRVLAITGDGEILMGLGALATIGVQRPRNLVIAVLDNERYGETGMQRTHTADGLDLCGVARAAGFGVAQLVQREEQLAGLRSVVHHTPGPALLQIKISAAKVPMVLPPRDGAFLRSRFRAAV